MLTGLVTVTLQVAEALSPAAAVISHFPAFTAVTRPVWSTVATSGSEVFHSRVWVAPSGLIVASSCAFSPSGIESSVLLISTVAASGITVTIHLPSILPEYAIMVAVPSASAVITPFSTDTMVGAVVFHSISA